jgi:putative ABC transport system permease protein
MSFVLKMAWRDTRASRRRLVLFSFTIVLGIAALVAVGSFGANLRQAVRDQPQTLLGADISIGLGSPPTAEFQRYLDSLGAQQGREKRYGATLTPVEGSAGNRSVQVRAIEGGFPFYGGFITEPADAVAQLQTDQPVVIVDPLILKQLNLRAGDRVKLGEKTYTIIGTVLEFPAQPAILATLVPRVFIPWRAMPPPKDPKAPRDQGFRSLFLKLPAGADQAAIARDLRSRFTRLFPRVTTADELAKNIDQALVAADRFLSLVVFVSLFLGAIGLASTLHVYIRQKLNTVAVLRCLGASAGASFSIYLLQTAALGLCGAAGGALLGIATQFALPTLLKDFLPLRLDVFIAWQPVFIGMGSGFGLCMAFTLLPLMAVRRVPPLAAMRSNILGGDKADPLQPLLWAIMAAAVVVFAWSQTRSWRWALAYSFTLAAAFGIFFGTARAVTWASRRWFPAAAPYAVRQGVANLHRPNNRTTLLLLALGLGLFLVLTLYLTRATLGQEYSGANSPNLVLAEIGDSDIATLRKLVPAQGGRLIQEIPSVELKLTTVNGTAPKPGNARGPGGRPGPDAFSSLRASYRRKLPAAEKVISGVFTGEVRPGTAIIPVSIQGWLTGRNGPLKLDDEVVWDVAGVPLRTRVTSIRRVEGIEFEPNFPVLFPAGALEAAPKRYMLLVRAATPAISRRIQQAAVAAAPGTVVQDLAVLVEALDRIFARVAALINFIAFFTVATGVILLAAAAVTGRQQRARETVLLRTLGASRLELRKIQFTEYAILGVLAALVGSLLATIVNLLLAHFLFKLPPALTPGELLAAAAAVVAVTVGTGVLADRGIARTPPLEILRQET